MLWFELARLSAGRLPVDGRRHAHNAGITQSPPPPPPFSSAVVATPGGTCWQFNAAAFMRLFLYDY